MHTGVGVAGVLMPGEVRGDLPFLVQVLLIKLFDFVLFW